MAYSITAVPNYPSSVPEVGGFSPGGYNPTAGVVQLPGQGGAPGPYTVDPGAAMSSYLGAFTPELMGNILNLERTYTPEFGALDLATRTRNVEDFGRLIGGLTRTAADVAKEESRIYSQTEIDRMKQFGGPGIAAYIAANPYLQSAMDRSDALGGVSTNAAFDALSRNLLGGAPSAVNLTARGVTPGMMTSGGTLTPERLQTNLMGAVDTLTPERVQAERVQAERVRAGQVQAGTVGSGALGESLYQQALQNQQLSPLSQALEQRGLGMVQTPGQLSPEEMRAATQGARERFASTGRLEDIAGVTGEALARAGASRERQMQDLAAAQAINAQVLGARQAGQQLATDVLRTDIQRQQANVGTQLQAGQFNVDAMLRGDLANQQTALQANLANQDAFLRAAMANQSAGLEAGKFNIGNQMTINQANQLAQNQFALANQQAGMEAGRFNIANANDISRFNISTGLEADKFTADAANRMAESNRAFNYTANQDYLRNLGMLGTSTSAMREADRAYNLNQVGAYGGVSRAGLDAIGYNQPPPGVANAMNYFTLGSNVTPNRTFDPNAGINLASTNAANLSNYYANIYSANQTRAAAEAAAAATKSAGKSSMFGNILGGALGGIFGGPAGAALGGLFGGKK
jgi:hypothetical protein